MACQQSLKFLRFSERSARARKRRETRDTRAAARGEKIESLCFFLPLQSPAFSHARVVIFVSRAFRSMDQEKEILLVV